jgi:hypothetical protein
MYKSGGENSKEKPDYLFPFLNYAVSNLKTYKQHQQQGINLDWRIKEALLCAIGHLQ